MEKSNKPIDYKQLERELQNAIRADELYNLQNDAKIRAIEQNVPTYEHFRQLVNGAHLKPLERGDISKKSGSAWNSVSNSFSSDSVGEYCDSENMKFDKRINLDDLVNTVTKTHSDFTKVWKSIEDYNSKFAYLWNIREDLSGKIFRMEIPPILFHELLLVCSSYAEHTDKIEEIIEILTILSKCNRFNLTISFMTSEEKRICMELFRLLLCKTKLQQAHLQETIKTLAVVYGTALV